MKKEDPFLIREILWTSFSKTNEELFSSGIDISFSGSTTVALLILNNKLWCANVGDSRAILVKFRHNQWRAYPLSTDHKPDLPGELSRITQAGGRVEGSPNEIGVLVGPKRVWVKDGRYPGLAMSRSMGDKVAAQVGVISEPGIISILED